MDLPKSPSFFTVTGSTYWLFSIGYYLCIIPFRPKWTPNGCVLVENKFQKILCCFFVWPLSCLSNVSSIFKIIADVSGVGITTWLYFATFNNLFYFGRKLNFYWVCYSLKKNVENWFNIFRSDTFLQPKNPFLITGLVYIALTFITRGALNITGFAYNGWGIVHDEISLFMTPTNLSSTSFNELPPQEIIWGLFSLTFKVADRLDLVITFTFFLAVVPVMLWIAMKNFENFTDPVLQSENIELIQCRMKLIEQKYFNLKALCMATNCTWGCPFFLFFLDYFVELTVTYLFHAKTPYQVFKMVYICVIVIAFLWISAEISRKMICFKVKLEDLKHRFAQNGHDFCFKSVLKDVSTGNSVGVGLTGVYNIDYAFIGQLVTVSLTLCIVSLESKC